MVLTESWNFIIHESTLRPLQQETSETLLDNFTKADRKIGTWICQTMHLPFIIVWLQGFNKVLKIKASTSVLDAWTRVTKI